MNGADILPIASRLLPYVPPDLGYRLCERCALFAPWMPAWPSILQNLRHVAPDAAEATYRRYARTIVSGLLKNYYDLLRSHALSAAELAATMDVQGLGNLECALAKGKGVIVAMPHLGNFSLIAEPVANLIRHPIVVAVEQMRNAKVHHLLNTLRERGNVEMLEVGPSIARPLLRALRANHIVVLLSERTVAGATVEVDFFGTPAKVPSGPATLALRTGAPLLTAYTYRRPDNRSTIFIDPPLAFEPIHDLRSDVRRLMQVVMRILESYIRRRPGQWLLTEPVWDAP
jgi:KDO2-lipid IV(A) lauroyltransferase